MPKSFKNIITVFPVQPINLNQQAKGEPLDGPASQQFKIDTVSAMS